MQKNKIYHVCYTPSRRPKLTTDHTNCRQSEETQMPLHYLRECKMVQLCWQAVHGFLKS